MVRVHGCPCSISHFASPDAWTHSHFDRVATGLTVRHMAVMNGPPGDGGQQLTALRIAYPLAVCCCAFASGDLERRLCAMAVREGEADAARSGAPRTSLRCVFAPSEACTHCVCACACHCLDCLSRLLLLCDQTALRSARSAARARAKWACVRRHRWLPRLPALGRHGTCQCVRRWRLVARCSCRCGVPRMRASAGSHADTGPLLARVVRVHVLRSSGWTALGCSIWKRWSTASADVWQLPRKCARAGHCFNRKSAAHSPTVSSPFKPVARGAACEPGRFGHGAIAVV
jgi:hypothetical protein